jgi:NAD(P)-dependent dehydrogenase (short-subunit alcohol dehydrogenase family)/acyl dehydratase
MTEQLTSTSGHLPISFTEQDLALFSEASGDRNPLHLNQDYARRTSYGQRVVFGCLGAMACLGHIRLPADWSATSLEANFLLPMFLGVQYRTETSRKGDRWEARLFDGSTAVVSLKVTAKISQREEAPEEDGVPAAFERRDAAVRQQESIVPGLTVCGPYVCNAAALATLAARWGCVDRFLPALLCWGSYLVGMELPGESALFSKLVLHFQGTARCVAAMTYQASIVSVNSRFGLLETKVSLLAGASTVASGQCWSYIRPPVPEVEKIDSAGVRPDSLAERVAVVLGSSRGLGAALKRALNLRGAAVFGMARSGNAGDMSRTEVGDARNPEALRRLRERVSKEQGRLDFLICNACPPVLPLLLEPNAAERIREYIDLAVSLTLAPLSEFLELLNRSDGCAVIISSVYVEHPVKEFPHYVAAKRAVEALACVASLQYPRVCTLIVRPPKLLTAMTNTPLGRLGAASPGMFANRIAARLEDPLEPGKTEILNFQGEIAGIG